MNTNIEKTNPVSIFKHEMFGDTRIIQEGDQLFFVAKDVVEKVGNVWKGAQTLEHIPEQWKKVTSVVTSFGTKEMTCLSEQGLYFYLGRCDKPAALQYQMWIAGEVVPSIRKTGGYIPVKPGESDLEIMCRAFQILQAMVENQKAQIAQDAPKVELADSYLTEGDPISMGDLAKKLHYDGIDIGQNRLFQLLRDKGVLIRRPGVTFNTPTQAYAARGWFKVIQPPPSQLAKWKKQIRITPKGVMEISKRMHELFGADFE